MEVGPIELAAGSVVMAESAEDIDHLATNPSFVIGRRQPAFQVSLMYRVVVIPPDERRPGFESNTRGLTVWVQGTEQVLSQIDRVTYYLHPTFNPSVVSRYSSSDRFALSFTAWGQFEIRAKVYFKDGQVKDLSRYLSF
ncbi:MAG: hypothetical protein DRP85_04470 [Candidatus Makaraimicrobium thalassicum]|nr:MAG: hypothetical protein DRP85_04470 [Candidatus Omnitrophota bacterium]